ncbi:hypothetical protein SLITK23_23350 [Streptomyces lividans]|uniref:PIN domain-containing protein n=3 Tax=Streptomyces TaxID=1883 RepID=Q9KXJ3_STRCO|nr:MULTISPECIES: hypothetical protein [Streptomyces]MYU41853.1 hypothetical protein [Streptomyces sp. SID7813]QSJ11709.1 hypothetical protein SLIVDG2_26085 [Streptomyces lividans]WOZ00832.1 hypothetical protein R2E43_26660 [Streptomyces violaceoruber]AIJ16128.1 hypothetical protein SLIV_26085 [Streptomyces lividans TK24]EFD69574.1 conserved hypothetical protein [Streptomyces lividans TK24]
MILHHLVLDAPTLVALSGNRQVSALIHRANFETETRLWVPALSVLEAERELLGITEHVGQLDVMHTVDLDYPAVLAVAQLSRDGVPPGIGAAIHAARHLPEWGADALIATVAPKAYEERGLPVLDLNR